MKNSAAAQNNGRQQEMEVGNPPPLTRGSRTPSPIEILLKWIYAGKELDQFDQVFRLLAESDVSVLIMSSC